MAKQVFQRKVKSPVEARGGYRDRPVFVVLVASIVLIVIGFIVAYGVI